MDRWTDRQINIQTDRQIEIWTDGPKTDKQIDRHRGRIMERRNRERSNFRQIRYDKY